MRLTHSTLALLATALLSTSLAAPIIGRRSLPNPSSSTSLTDQQESQAPSKRWIEPEYGQHRSASFLGDGHAVFDDDDDDAGNEMLDTEEGLLRPDADDEYEGTIEGQVLEEEEEDDDDAGPLSDADLDAINSAFLDQDDAFFSEPIARTAAASTASVPASSSSSSPVVVVPLSSPSLVDRVAAEALARPVIMARLDGARTRSRALK